MRATPGESAPPPATRRCRFLMIAVLLAAGFGVYANAIPNRWAYDDRPLIRKSDIVQGEVGPAALLDPAAYYRAAAEDNYIPLTTLSLMADHAAWGDDPAGFHRTNVAIHLAVSLLVFFLLRALIGCRRTAFLGALLFAVHPIHTESVSWIAGRTDLLCALLFLPAILLYLRAVPHPGEGADLAPGSTRARFRPLLYTASLLAFALSLFFKEMSITLLPVLLLIDLTAAREHPGRTVARRARYYSGYLAITLLYLAGRLFLFNKGILDPEVYPGGSLDTSLLTMARGFVFYIGKLILPVRLCVYTLFRPSTSITEPAVLVSAGILLALVFLAVWLRGRSRVIPLGIGWFFVTMIPVSNLVPVPGNIIAERYLYLPSIGFCLIAAAGIVRLRAVARGAIAAAVALVLLVGYGAATVSRNRDWRDDISLWTSAIEVYPENGKAYLNRGFARMQRGEFRLAIADYDRALAIDPRFALAYHNRGTALATLGRYKAALDDYDRAIRLDPTLVNAYLGRASVERNLGRPDLAERDEERARRLSAAGGHR